MKKVNTTISGACEALISARENWENNELAASNAKLYSILSRCFDVYKQLAANVFLVDEVNDLLTAKDIKFISTLHPANKLIKLIFGDKDRRRVSAYATVMKAALEEADDATANFAAWVTRKHGVEAIRTGNTTDGVKAAAKSADAFNKAAAQLSKERAIATINPSSKFPDGTGYVMVLAHIASDRSLSVVKFLGDINDDRVKTQVIKVAADAEKKSEEEEDKRVDKAVAKAVKKNINHTKRVIKKQEEDAKKEKSARAAELDKELRENISGMKDSKRHQNDECGETIDENIKWDVSYSTADGNEQTTFAA